MRTLILLTALAIIGLSQSQQFNVLGQQTRVSNQALMLNDFQDQEETIRNQASMFRPRRNRTNGRMAMDEPRQVVQSGYGQVQMPSVQQQQRPVIPAVVPVEPTVVRPLLPSDMSQRPQFPNGPQRELQVRPAVEPVASVSPAVVNPFLVSNQPQTPLQPCDANPCFNNAECLNLPNGDFRCQCPWGWTGARCQICLTDCASNPCPANKRCRARYGGGFDCICPPDRTGFNCEIQNDLCASQPCLNGGQCQVLDDLSSYQCICPKPFAGKNCEAQWSNPCTEEALRSSDVLQFQSPWNRTFYIICVDVGQWVEMPCSTGTVFSERLGHCIPEGFEEPLCPDRKSVV